MTLTGKIRIQSARVTAGEVCAATSASIRVKSPPTETTPFSSFSAIRISQSGLMFRFMPHPR